MLDTGHGGKEDSFLISETQRLVGKPEKKMQGFKYCRRGIDIYSFRKYLLIYLSYARCIPSHWKCYFKWNRSLYSLASHMYFESSNFCSGKAFQITVAKKASHITFYPFNSAVLSTEFYHLIYYILICWRPVHKGRDFFNAVFLVLGIVPGTQ